MFKFTAGCGSFLGNGRNLNEDNFYFDKKHLPVSNKGLKNPLKFSGKTESPVLVAVFDGIGGASKGEEASFCASEVFSEEFKKLEEVALSGKEFLCTACNKANTAVGVMAKERHLGSMGTTVAAIYIFQDEVVACNVGDSKVFRIRDGKMIQISEDHTDEKIMTSIGVKKKPVLLQYIGVPDTEMAIDPYITKGELQVDDVYVICSDGVTDVLSVNEMYEILTRDKSDEVVRQLLAQVDKKNGDDNATVIVVKIIKCE